MLKFQFFWHGYSITCQCDFINKQDGYVWIESYKSFSKVKRLLTVASKLRLLGYKSMANGIPNQLTTTSKMLLLCIDE